MKKILLLIFILIVISIAACQQNQDVMEKKNDAMEKTGTAISEADTTGNAAVDAVGDDLSAANADEKDLGTDEFSDLDSGLSDAQNI